MTAQIFYRKSMRLDWDGELEKVIWREAFVGPLRNKKRSGRKSKEVKWGIVRFPANESSRLVSMDY